MIMQFWNSSTTPEVLKEFELLMIAWILLQWVNPKMKNSDVSILLPPKKKEKQKYIDDDDELLLANCTPAVTHYIAIIILYYNIDWVLTKITWNYPDQK